MVQTYYSYNNNSLQKGLFTICIVYPQSTVRKHITPYTNIIVLLHSIRYIVITHNILCDGELSKWGDDDCVSRYIIVIIGLSETLLMLCRTRLTTVTGNLPIKKRMLSNCTDEIIYYYLWATTPLDDPVNTVAATDLTMITRIYIYIPVEGNCRKL